MGINLSDFLQRASNPTEYKINLSPRGEVKYQRTKALMQKFLSTFKKKSKEVNDIQFTYEVIIGVIGLLREEKTPQKPTIEKAAQAFYERIKDQWEQLDDDKRERFFELPELFSFHAYENKNVVENQMLRKLNQSFANSIGADVFRLITNESLSLILPDATIATPSFSDPGSLFDFSKNLCETLHLSKQTHEQLTVCLYSGQTKFEKFFDIPRMLSSHQIDQEEYGLLCGLFNSFSQAAVLEVGGILMRTFDSPFRPVFANGTHDAVELDLSSSIVQVRHRFQLAFRQNHKLAKDLDKACFDVQTNAKFNVEDENWLEFHIAISIIDHDLTPRMSAHLREKLRRVGC